MTDSKPIDALVEIREGLPSDLDFIYSTWLKGLYYGNDWFNLTDKKTFFKVYPKVIEKILYKPDTIILTACLKDDPDVIIGYSVCEFQADINILHWVFVKNAWRKLGVAKMLTPGDIESVTHLTSVGKAIKPEDWAFNPFLI